MNRDDKTGKLVNELDARADLLAYASDLETAVNSHIATLDTDSIAYCLADVATLRGFCFCPEPPYIEIARWNSTAIDFQDSSF